MAEKLAIADARLWLQATLRRRIEDRRNGIGLTSVDVPSLRTRAKMAVDPGAHKPLRIREVTATAPTDISHASEERRSAWKALKGA